MFAKLQGHILNASTVPNPDCMIQNLLEFIFLSANFAVRLRINNLASRRYKMKLVDYKSDDGEVIEMDFSKQEIPPKVVQNGKTYYRVYGASIVIPPTFKAGSNESEFRYKKPPLESNMEFR